jgi:hypothetical protein
MELPVPIQFELPEGWQPAPPDELCAPEAAFVALNTATQGSGFTANIAIDGGILSPGETLAELAGESARRLARSARQLTVRGLCEVGEPEAPGLAQDLLLVTEIGGARRDLAQFQVYLTMGRSAERNGPAVIRAALTCTAEQADAVLGDFRSFVRTLAPDT